MSKPLWEDYSDQSDAESPEDELGGNTLMKEATKEIFLRKYKNTDLPEETLFKVFEDCNYNDLKIQDNLRELLNKETKSYVIVDNPFKSSKNEERKYKKNYYYGNKSYYYGSSYNDYNYYDSYDSYGNYYKQSKNYSSSKFYKPRKSYYSRKRYEPKNFYTQEVELEEENNSFNQEKETIEPNWKTENSYLNQPEKVSKEFAINEIERMSENKFDMNGSKKSENETLETITNNCSEENERMTIGSAENSTFSAKEEKTQNSLQMNDVLTEEYFSSSKICSNFIPKKIIYEPNNISSYNVYSSYLFPGKYADQNQKKESQEKCWERVALYYDCFKKQEQA